jgi:hypothetical protein
MNELDELDYDETYEDEYMAGNNDEDMMDEEGGDQQIDDYDDDQQQMGEETMASGQDVYHKKKLVRCTFWPLCEKGEACHFLHPSKPCTAFPACQFGQLCHYVHPNCRYDGFCTRPDCPFTHNVKRGTAVEPATSSVMVDLSAKQASSSSASSSQSQDVPRVTINKIQPFNSGSVAHAAIANPFSLVNKTESGDAGGSQQSFKPSASQYVPPSRGILYPLQSSTAAVGFHAGSQYKIVNSGKLSSAPLTATSLPVSLIFN